MHTGFWPLFVSLVWKPKYEPNPHTWKYSHAKKFTCRGQLCFFSFSQWMDSCSQNSAAKPVIKKMLHRKHCVAVLESNNEQEESDRCRRNISSVRCGLKKSIIRQVKMKTRQKENPHARNLLIGLKENGLQNEYLSSMHHTGMLLNVSKNQKIQNKLDFFRNRIKIFRVHFFLKSGLLYNLLTVTFTYKYMSSVSFGKYI